MNRQNIYTVENYSGIKGSRVQMHLADMSKPRARLREVYLCEELRAGELDGIVGIAKFIEEGLIEKESMLMTAWNWEELGNNCFYIQDFFLSQ